MLPNYFYNIGTYLKFPPEDGNPNADSARGYFKG